MANRFKFSTIFSAVDKYSPTIKKMAGATASFGKSVNMATRKAELSLSRLSSKFSKTGKKIRGFGKTSGLFVTAPIVAAGKIAIDNFDKQAKAIASVEATLKSTGGTVGLTSLQLQKAASDLQKKTLFGDEEILQNATGQLLTFTNITENQFLRTQTAALNLAAKLDGDLKSASIQLGKALNDPAKNLSALSRSGIQFSKEQIDIIKKLQKTNRLAEAQNLILNELDKQYGGTAEAIAKVGKGPITQTLNKLSDMSEKIGKHLTPHVDNLLKKISDLAERFINLNPEQQKTVLTVIAIAAALPPLIFLIGTMSAGLGVLAAAASFIISPVGLVIAGFVGLFIALQNFKKLPLIFKIILTPLKIVFEVVKKIIKFLGRITGITSAVTSLASKVSGVFGMFSGGDDKKKVVDSKSLQPSSSSMIQSLVEKRETSSVDVNFNNLPKGTEVNTSKDIPNLNLNLGFSGA